MKQFLFTYPRTFRAASYLMILFHSFSCNILHSLHPSLECCFSLQLTWLHLIIQKAEGGAELPQELLTLWP